MTETKAAWPPWRIAVWGIALLLMIWWRGAWFVQTLRPSGDAPIVDFFQEWSSARLFRDGEPIYEEQATAVKRYLGREVQRADVGLPELGASTAGLLGSPFGEGPLLAASAVLPGRTGDPRIHFNDINAHPPPDVLLVLPLSWLDYRDACLVWNLVSLALLGGSFWLVLRQLDMEFSAWALLPLFTCLLICRPLSEQIVYGQLNGILDILIVGAWVAERSGRPWRAGALLGAATAVKLFPGFLFLPFLVRRQWRVVMGGILSFVLLNAVTAAVLGPGTFPEYALHVVPRLSKYHSYWVNVSLVGFCFKLFDASAKQTIPLIFSPEAARVGALLGVAAVTVIVIGIARTARSRKAQDHLFGVTVMAMLLVSPITWSHYFLLLLLPVFLLWRDLPDSGASRIIFSVSLILMWLPIFTFWKLFLPGTDMEWWMVEALPWQTLTIVSIHTYALLALFVLGLLTFRDANRGGLPSPVQREVDSTVRRRLFQDLPAESG
jgi:hypothetical protein